ncbi:hypothetical protein L873DRAFT_99073 [Choiromyces venosus 120613-1]|uniref:Uncharacterized protein n=1 Tax=Choiromyces venosus 120613-1 TaxID=1336337 RepID=A0A3N4JZJ6_9PEZI|nr:hypothetical protein L873DRAFT_99073 [Choiromyces venosus 120613-1]
MEVAGIAIAVFNEVFVIGKFIGQVLVDAAHQDDSFRKLDSDLKFQQTLLSTFGKRFLESGFINEIEDTLKDQITTILQELKSLVGEYGRLAARYDKEYSEALKEVDKWWEVGIGSSGKQKGAGEPKLIQLESIEIPEPTNPPKHERKRAWSGWCFPRAQLSQKFASLEWALFNKDKLESLVRDYKDLVGKLMEVTKLTLLTWAPFSTNLDTLRDFQRKDAKTLGMSKITTARMFIVKPSEGEAVELDSKLITTVSEPQGHTNSPKAAASLIGEGNMRNGKYNNQNILIEYKHDPEPQETTSKPEITKGRIQFLSKLLGVECRDGEPTESNNFTLRCLGYFHEPEERRYGLAFAFPHGREKPMSLHTVISSLKKESRPTLGQRFTIAHSIGYTLMEWFLVGWVHKSINSKNILFFHQEHQGLDFDSPYLCGFEYSRPGREESNEIVKSKGVHWDLYRHPARQGLPTEAFEKIHDIYAFGVLLLELGLWQLAPKLIDPAVKANPGGIKEILVKNAGERLGHFMGQKYRDAVLLCLNSSLAVDSKLIATFGEQVVSVLEEGRKL